MSYGETVDLEFLGRQQAQLLEEIRLLRQESRAITKSFGGISEHFSRQEHDRDDHGQALTLAISALDRKLDAVLQTLSPD